MSKFLIVFVPMFAGAVLAGTVRAETLVDLRDAAAPAAAAGQAALTQAQAAMVSAHHTGGLPTSASWAVMATGFAAAGGVARARRTKAA